MIDVDPSPDLAQDYSCMICKEQMIRSSKSGEYHHDAVGFVTRRESGSDSVGFQSRLESSISTGGDQNREHSLLCSHCGCSGHEKAFCWQLNGYPEWYT